MGKHTEELNLSAAQDAEYGFADPFTLRMTIPKGRMQEKVLAVLEQIGLSFLANGRSYRPICSDSTLTTKMLKAQNIPGLVALGRHDCGFSGHDWIVEQQADIVELLDLKLDPVRIVAAMPEDLLTEGDFRMTNYGRPLIVASEYRNLANTSSRAIS